MRCACPVTGSTGWLAIRKRMGGEGWGPCGARRGEDACSRVHTGCMSRVSHRRALRINWPLQTGFCCAPMWAPANRAGVRDLSHGAHPEPPRRLAQGLLPECWNAVVLSDGKTLCRSLSCLLGCRLQRRGQLPRHQLPHKRRRPRAACTVRAPWSAQIDAPSSWSATQQCTLSLYSTKMQQST